jgi:hypothetical protein
MESDPVLGVVKTDASSTQADSHSSPAMKWPESTHVRQAFALHWEQVDSQFVVERFLNLL